MGDTLAWLRTRSFFLVLAALGLARSLHVEAACSASENIGVLPTMFSDSVALPTSPFGYSWAFELVESRRVAVELVPSNMPAGGSLHWSIANCRTAPDLFAPQSSECLRPDDYSLFVWTSSPGVTGDLVLRDLGPCVPPSALVVNGTRVVEVDGDGDGFADTGETVDVYLSILNKSDHAVTNVVATASSGDPTRACVALQTATLASLAAGASAETTTPFRFTVSPGADRRTTGRTPDDEFAAEFVVNLSADQMPLPSVVPVAVELDLNSSVPAVATTAFAEGFEGGLGNFSFMNLDTNIASNSASDGYRCQYNDPDFINSNSYGQTDCYLGFASGLSVNTNDWHVHSTSAPDGGRAHAGTRSVHFGRHTTAGMDTYDLSQLDAIRTKVALRLAARVCAQDVSAHACNGNSDCVAFGGGPCVGASPQLSFVHQVSTVDARVVPVSSIDEAADRAVVQVRVGTASWHNVPAYMNGYDATGQDDFDECTFDPIDDGNDEDDRFGPGSPFGPSSTCNPEPVFSYLGDTDDALSVDNVGRGEGPGLPGSLGPGTWVESRIDLTRYRGRSIIIRFLVTTIKAGDQQSHESTFQWNPTPVDDGWYIDDVRVTQTLGTSVPTAGYDDAPSPSADTDGDGAADGCDCAPGNPAAWAIPPEVPSLAIAADKVTLSWSDGAFDSTTVHDVLRGLVAQLPVGSGGGEACVGTVSSGSSIQDAATPTAGTAYWYLVRARNVCAGGSYGSRSDGAARVSAVCP